MKPGVRPGAEVYEIDVDSDAADVDSQGPIRGGSERAGDLRRRSGSDDLDGLDLPGPASLDLDGVPGDPLDLELSTHARRSLADSIPDALELIHRQDPSSIVPEIGAHRHDPMGELGERYALGDFSGALTLAEAVLKDDPGSDEAHRYATSCRDVLKRMYTARLGPVEGVPIVAVPKDQLRWLTLDHRAGFLLSHIDGVSTIEELLDICGMPHLEAMRILFELVQQKVVVVS